MENNFHIFYSVLENLVARGECELYHVTAPSFAFLPPSPMRSSEKRQRKLEEVKEAFSTLGVDVQEQETIFRVLIAILLLGELQFFRQQQRERTRVRNFQIVQKVGLLLEVQGKSLGWALTNYCLLLDGEFIRRNLSEEEAVEMRNGLARNLYARLVDWIVNIINKNLSLGHFVFADERSLGILDLPGFACFLEDNTFDNFRINVLNEQMEFIYNRRVFFPEREDAEELSEEMTYNFLKSRDNGQILEAVLLKPGGLLHFLDQQTKGTANESTFSERVKEALPSKFFVLKDECTFVVAHYSGQVRYDARTFQDMNRDFLSPEIIEVMRQSKNSIVVALFTNKLTKTGNLTASDAEGKSVSRWVKGVSSNHKALEEFNAESRGRYSQTREMRTSGEVLRSSLLELLQRLSTGSAHFVRCIRSNLKRDAFGFDSALVKYQIRALGIVNSVRMRQNGYSRRLGFSEFLQRYKFLAFDYDEVVEEKRENCRLLLVRLKLEGWALGKSKVLLKYYNEEFLSRLYEEQIYKVVKVQAIMRTFLARRRANQHRPSAIRPKSLPEGVFTVADVHMCPCPSHVKESLKSAKQLANTTLQTPTQENEVPEVEELDLDSVPAPQEIRKQFTVENVGIGAGVGGRCMPLTSATTPQVEVEEMLHGLRTPMPINYERPTPMRRTLEVGNAVLVANPLLEFIQSATATQSSGEVVGAGKLAGVSPDAGPFNFQAMLRKTNRNIVKEDEAKPKEILVEAAQKAARRNLELVLQEQNTQKSPAADVDEENQNGAECVVLSPGIVVFGLVEDL